MEKHALIYTKDHCPYCDMAKKLLNKNNIRIEEINISSHPQPELIIEKIKEITTQKTFPQIILDGKHIGGYNDLQALFISP